MDIIPSPPHEPLDIEHLEDLFSGDSDIDLLAQTISPGPAMLLLKHFRGADLKVPKKVKPNSALAQKLGFENAKIIADYMSGGRIIIPTRHPAHAFMLDRHVAVLIKAGLPRSEIATELGVSERQVRRIVSRIGMSGVSYVSGVSKTLSVSTDVNRSTCSLSAPPESVFNGGLTGVTASLADPDPLEGLSGGQCAI